MIESFSGRGREVVRAIERFRAEHGRAPEVRELQALKLENRRAKVVVTKADLQRAWNETAARHDFDADRLVHDGESIEAPERSLEDRIEQRLTEHAATFPASELRAVALEQSTGELSPEQAVALTKRMIAERRVLPLEGGLMTTLTVRAREQAIERRFAEFAKPAERDVGERSRTQAASLVRDRIGAPLSAEQLSALRAISGPERGAVLVGPAGTGKGVVIDAAARAEQLAGTETFGIAVAGATAQRLGQDSPALAGRTLTLDALVARADRGQLALGQRTTVYFDEAGMADTARLDRLTELIADRGAKLVVIGDAAQLPSIGAGGMFERLAELVPSAELSNVRRTLDPAEQRAWAELRAGRAERAMAHYLAAGRLHFSDERDQAVEHAVSEWAKLTERHPVEEVTLVSDASNKEIDRMNARAQHHRAARGELGDVEVQVPDVHYGLRAGDRVALIAQHRREGMARIENGERGEVLAIEPNGAALIEFDSGERRGLAGEELEHVRLAYAQHIHRAQGATVTRTLVVTGGWQTSKEPAYVEASRARRGTDWFLAREDLGVEGQDSERIARLAQRMSESRAQVPSLAHAELPDMRNGPGFRDPVEHAHAIPPGSPVCFIASPERSRTLRGSDEPQVPGDVVRSRGRAARAARRRRRRTAYAARRSLHPKRTRPRRRRGQGAPAAPRHSGHRCAAGRRARALARAIRRRSGVARRHVGATRRAARPLLEGPLLAAGGLVGGGGAARDALCARGVARRARRQRHRRARGARLSATAEKLFRVVRAAGGGVSRAWKPGAMPDSWRED